MPCVVAKTANAIVSLGFHLGQVSEMRQLLKALFIEVFV